MATTPVGRVLTAMVTPFDPTGKVDIDQAKRLAEALINSGSDGLVVTGTTGESPTLSNDEKLSMYEAVVSAVGTKASVIAGTTTYNTAESVHLSREAESLGVDGFLLTVPYYNKPPQEGLYRHFSAIADSVSKPCILYNVPSRTVLNMSSDTTIRLSHVSNIIGVKEASADFPQIGRIIGGAGPDFLVWSGNDSDTLPILKLGGYGIVSVVAHIVGRQVREMIDAYIGGEVDQAESIHERLLPLVDMLFIESNPIPVKHMLSRVGFDAGDPRLPLVKPSQQSIDSINAELAKHEIDIRVPARV